MEDKNKPVISNRDKTLSVSVFRRDKTDENGNQIITLGFSAQRAYKDKNTGEWLRKDIQMFPEEVLRMANLLQKSYMDAINYLETHRPQRNQTEHPQASMNTPEDMPESTLDDDIPF